jgi:hypothetical protein
VTVSAEDWAKLEAQPGNAGTVRRRLHPESPRDLFVELDLDSRVRRFTYRRPWAVGKALPTMPRTRSLDCSGRVGDGGAEMAISVELREPSLADVFTAVVEDLAAAVVHAGTDDEAVTDLAVRLVRWQELFRSLSREGLGDLERRGLVGELLVLRDDLLPLVRPETAVAAWTGPLRRNQDFQLPHCALEVKTTAGLNPQGFVVANERELDDRGIGRLHLVHISLDERLGGDGFSLLQLAREVEGLVSGNPTAHHELFDRLARVGFLRGHSDLYEEPHYNVRSRRYYDVTGAFPRITEGDLREGVGKVTYAVTLAACAPFEVDRSAVQSSIGTTGESA